MSRELPTWFSQEILFESPVTFQGGDELRLEFSGSGQPRAFKISEAGRAEAIPLRSRQGLPSAADLDAVAEEQRIAAATAAYATGSGELRCASCEARVADDPDFMRLHAVSSHGGAFTAFYPVTVGE